MTTLLRRSWLVSVACALLASAAAAQPKAGMDYANVFDKAAAGKYEKREADWRNGAVVYQVLVDRFAPSANLAAKRALYPAPKRLREWAEEPRGGTFLQDVGVWSHEIDFWGGDLASTAAKLDHVQGLGADVLYLNPIHLGYTNHKYDSLDYNAISPEFGTRDDVKKLAAELKRRNMKLVLDGVFNHMGHKSKAYLTALEDHKAGRKGAYSDWFYFGPQYKDGVRRWWNVPSLPELNLESKAVQAHVYAAPDSVVRSFLRDGVDGWRLDVAFDIGFAILSDLTKAAHAQKPGSLVVGEIANYPKEWFPSVDGIMHFSLRNILLRTADRRIPPATAMRMFHRLVTDADYEHILKSWIYLDNHDTFRLATTLPDPKARRIAQVLQFTLPGAPNLYYGSEVAMEGGDDPEMRGPMRWDRVDQNHPDLGWTKQLVALRKQHRALRVGDWRTFEATNLIAFQRHTDRAADAIYVFVNPSLTEVSETVLITDSKAMDGTTLKDVLDGTEVRVVSALVDLKLPPQTARVMRPVVGTPEGYNNYKRVK
jgi:cyclomaltodextrinase / maltogenic alpha-amylase / neopullulanase